jgi:hypothetical protein
MGPASAMNHARTIARSVGILMLAAFLLYGVGSSIATTAASGSPLLTVGVAMMLLNSVAVIAIGALVLPILRPRTPVAAGVYLGARIFESVFLGAGAIALLMASAGTNFVV